MQINAPMLLFITTALCTDISNLITKDALQPEELKENLLLPSFLSNPAPPNDSMIYAFPQVVPYSRVSTPSAPPTAEVVLFSM